MSDNHHEQHAGAADSLAVPIRVDDAFHVVDEQSANWVIRKITESRRYGDRVRAWAAAEIRRSEREEAFLMRRFGRELEDWCRHQLAERGHRQRSLNLPAGRVGFRRTRMTVDIDNPATALTWCRRHLPNAIIVTERISKTQMSTFVHSTGELPGGVSIRPASDEMYVLSPAEHASGPESSLE